MQLLRFITCGSVDDGKSTLIGRLLYESQLLYDDQLATLATDSRKFGTTDHEFDFSLLVDGLMAEREQKITIDVAYRFFSTAKRKFIVADTPGHEQYTRNMATGASTADLAIVMVDARKGLLTQTRRHTLIVSMMGVKHLTLVINKMDLVSFEQAPYEQIKADYLSFAASLGITSVETIPVSALLGDNMLTRSTHTPWYKGPMLMQHLETVNVEPSKQSSSLCMPVQWVNRPHAEFRGFAGRINAGIMHSGQRVKILPSGKEAEIARIITYEGDLDRAVAGQSITCTLKEEIDVSRGDVMVSANDPCEIASQFESKLLWMSEKPLSIGRHYFLKIGTQILRCALNKPKYRIDVNTMEQLAADTLVLNDLGICDIRLNSAIPFEPYATNRELGGFILIDPLNHDTVAAGLIQGALQHPKHLHWQEPSVTSVMRAAHKMQKPYVIWLTGLSGAGKSTLANLVEHELNALGHHTMLLDGDNIRHGLNRDLGFNDADRIENIRRVAEVAKLMTEAGLITLVAFISPFAAERAMARELIGSEQFMEVFVDASLEVVEKRDVKGLYKKARAGKIKQFTGIDSPYEAPINSDLHLDTTQLKPEEAARALIALLSARNVI